MKTLNDLKPHEFITIDKDCHYWVLRVPGGLIYYCTIDGLSACFVPISDECDLTSFPCDSK